MGGNNTGFSARFWRRVWVKGGRNTCAYCDRPTRRSVAPGVADRATVEHLVRKADGGSNNADNLVLACYSCNHFVDQWDRGDWHFPLSEGQHAILERRRVLRLGAR